MILEILFEYSSCTSLVKTTLGNYEVLKHVALKLEPLILVEIKKKDA